MNAFQSQGDLVISTEDTKDDAQASGRWVKGDGVEVAE